MWDGIVAAQKAMSAILRTGQRFGASHLIDLLRGKVTERMAQLGHDALPTFGVGADLDEAGWRSVFRQLLAGGLLHADAQAYGALKLTDAARPVLKGEAVLNLRRQVVKSRERSALAGRRNKQRNEERRNTAFAAQSPEDESLFETLRAWRAEQAKAQGVPAYVIMHDKTLHELAARKPENLSELLNVPGIGLAKGERYGAVLLALIPH
jgi:ATP-dependent DNA helicase RecQ